MTESTSISLADVTNKLSATHELAYFSSSPRFITIFGVTFIQYNPLPNSNSQICPSTSELTDSAVLVGKSIVVASKKRDDDSELFHELVRIGNKNMKMKLPFIKWNED